MDLRTALYFCGGAARPDRLREIGVSPQALRAGRRAGLVSSRGTYALPDTPPAILRAVRCVDPRAASPLESVLRLGLRTLNCELQSQVSVEDVGDVDFVLDGWLAIEGDGFSYHSDRAAYRNDRSRGNALVLRRHVLLRFTYEDVRYRMGWVLDLVSRVLAAGPPWVLAGT